MRAVVQRVSEASVTVLSDEPGGAARVSGAIGRGFCALVRERGIEVQEGVFRATMQVRIVNEGPVTLLLDSAKNF